jgi:hypothetical protein
VDVVSRHLLKVQINTNRKISEIMEKATAQWRDLWTN